MNLNVSISTHSFSLFMAAGGASAQTNGIKNAFTSEAIGTLAV
jgi:hypothetical protein